MLLSWSADTSLQTAVEAAAIICFFNCAIDSWDAHGGKSVLGRSRMLFCTFPMSFGAGDWLNCKSDGGEVVFHWRRSSTGDLAEVLTTLTDERMKGIAATLDNW